jgi:putative PIN family toxin of toxin-antitoxin system
MMDVPNIVIDTNVVVSALRSKKGASFKLLSMTGTKRYKTHDSVPLVLEYEEVLQRNRGGLGLSKEDISDLIDSLCSLAEHHEIYFLWRPSLTDANDELILELVVTARCEYIVTHNIGDFKGSEKFGVKIVTPGAFLKIIGEV